MLKSYIALIRAINVGGHSIIKMTGLKDQFESLGFTDVKTYIQTGNVVFKAQENLTDDLAKIIEKKLETSLGYNGTVFVFSPSELEQAANSNPFHPGRFSTQQHCYLLFLKTPPSALNVRKVMELQGEEYRFALKGKVFYYAYLKTDASRRRMLNFEKVLAAVGTARSWRVIDKLIELAA